MEKGWVQYFKYYVIKHTQSVYVKRLSILKFGIIESLLSEQETKLVKGPVPPPPEKPETVITKIQPNIESTSNQ